MKGDMHGFVRCYYMMLAGTGRRLFGVRSRHCSAYSIGEWESMHGGLVSFC